MALFEKTISAINPATNKTYWSGKKTNLKDIDALIKNAHVAQKKWKTVSLKKRVNCIKEYQKQLIENKKELSEIISKETGKPYWESEQEVEAMIGKIDISITAFDERCPTKTNPSGTTKTVLNHEPHGVLGIISPFNFPGHLANGHFIPAIIAGNAIILKPSEETPLTALYLQSLWKKTSLTKNIFNVILGTEKEAKHLCNSETISGILFTGSFAVGVQIAQKMAQTPYKICALEMGGNNALIVDSYRSMENALTTIIQSAFISTGQRCTCARRLIIIDNKRNRDLIEKLVVKTQKLVIGPPEENPFMGPLINRKSVEKLLSFQKKLIKGGKALLKGKSAKDSCFVTPSIIDVSNLKKKEDIEIFGPLLQIIWVNDIQDAISEANKTSYGLSLSVISIKKSTYHLAKESIQCGVINWNMATTGAKSSLPFGGCGKSGNHRPTAFYAADYCSYPVASMEALHLPKISNQIKGIS